MAIMNKDTLYFCMERMREKYGIGVPFDPYELARRLSISVYGRYFDNPMISGMLLRGGHFEKSIIVLNESRSMASQRFSLAHELVHYELHPGILYFMCDNRRSPIEWQASEGAADLFVPYRSFLRSLPNKRSIIMRETDWLTTQLARKYGIGEAVITNRFRTLAYEIDQRLQGVPVDQIEVLSRSGQRARGISVRPVIAEYRRPYLPEITMTDEEWTHLCAADD